MADRLISLRSCRLALAVAGALFAIALAADRAAAQCAEGPAPVRLDVDQPEPTLNRQRSIDDLRKLAHSDPHEVALGLYTGELRTSLKVDFQSTERGDRACLRVSGAHIDVVYTKRMIYLARELARGSCQYNIALEHERRHASIDDTVLARELPRLKRAIADAIARIGAVGPVHPTELDDEREKIAASLQRVMGAEVTRIDSVRRKEQGAIDTPEAYRHEAARCPGGLDVR